jgi:hypothetical protein
LFAGNLLIHTQTGSERYVDPFLAAPSGGGSKRQVAGHAAT